MQLNNEWNVMLLMLPPKHGIAMRIFITLYGLAYIVSSTKSQDKVCSFQEYLLSFIGIATGAFQRQVSSFNIQELKGLGAMKASLV
jgi:hypothetical protein